MKLTFRLLPFHNLTSSCSLPSPDHCSESGLAEDRISSLPARQICAREGKRLSVEGVTCSVCLDPFCAGEVVRQLPCDHMFHSNCIDRWLRKKASCPECRRCCRASEK